MKYIKLFENYSNNLNINFKHWFGKSIMVDNNEPIILSHFSNSKFNTFVKKTGFNSHLFNTEEVNREGFFFTTDIEFASQYGKERYDVYLKIDKIFNFNEHYYYKDITLYTSDFFDEIIDYIEDNGIDLTMEYQSYRGELKIKPEYVWKFFDGEIGKLFINFIKSYGYDGAFFIEENKSPIYVVFDSNQIKSVDNDGSWDMNDSNIYS